MRQKMGAALNVKIRFNCELHIANTASCLTGRRVCLTWDVRVLIKFCCRSFPVRRTSCVPWFSTDRLFSLTLSKRHKEGFGEGFFKNNRTILLEMSESFFWLLLILIYVVNLYFSAQQCKKYETNQAINSFYRHLRLYQLSFGYVILV